MKEGYSWNQFWEVANRAEELKKDYEVRSAGIHVRHNAKHGLAVHLENTNQDYRLGEVAHEQLATLVGIPRNYYNRMLVEHPRVLASLAEMHLHKDEGIPEERFVRTIGNKVRAFLSTRYGVLDHVDVARMLQSRLPAMGGELKSIICNERRLTFQWIFPRLEANVSPQVGDVVQAGLAITNSEVGLGMFRIELLLMYLVCLNGMIKPSKGDWKLERVHVGQIDLGVLGEYTQDRLLALPDAFGETVEMVRRADGLYVPEDEIAVTVENVRRDHALTVFESEAVLEEFYGAGHWTKWGLVNAINVQAHTCKDDGRSVELERISGEVLDKVA